VASLKTTAFKVEITKEGVMEIEFEGQKYTAKKLSNGKVRITDSEGLSVTCRSVDDFIAELNGCEC
jgi:hypothetical protein